MKVILTPHYPSYFTYFFPFQYFVSRNGIRENVISIQYWPPLAWHKRIVLYWMSDSYNIQNASGTLTVSGIKVKPLSIVLLTLTRQPKTFWTSLSNCKASFPSWIVMIAPLELVCTIRFYLFYTLTVWDVCKIVHNKPNIPFCASVFFC